MGRRGGQKLGDDVLPRTDLTGRRFGRLTVRSFAGRRAYQNQPFRQAMWTCECECGGVHTVRGDSLKAGLTRSCGCLPSERGKTIYLKRLDALVCELHRRAESRCLSRHERRMLDAILAHIALVEPSERATRQAELRELRERRRGVMVEVTERPLKAVG